MIMPIASALLCPTDWCALTTGALFSQSRSLIPTDCNWIINNERQNGSLYWPIGDRRRINRQQSMPPHTLTLTAPAVRVALIYEEYIPNFGMRPSHSQSIRWSALMEHCLHAPLLALKHCKAEQ